MKKYFTIILSTFLVAGIVNAFQPATLFIETWNGIKRQAVYTQEQADKLFKDDWKLEKQPPMLGGVAYTTISGSDTMKNFPTTYNANNVLFDAGKIDVGTTSVASITTLSNLTSTGALSSGSLTTGFTKINVAQGGTGSTTLAQYQVLIGSSTNAIGVVAGVGTSGQSLVSNGTGLAPTWQTPAVNQTADYNWTGQHTGIGIVGEIIAYASSTAPTGWLLCNGASIATSTYSGLYSLIGYYYGGSGANFSLPDLRGRNVLMASSTANMGQTGGESNHTQTWDELAAHSHTYTSQTGSNAAAAGTYMNQTSFGANSGTTGSSTPMNILDPYLVLNYIIKF